MQTGNRLVYDCLKDAGSDVLPPCALIQEGLDVRLGENTAAGGDGIHFFRTECHLIQLVYADIQQRCHLVDKSARTAGTAAVHALFHTAGKEDDLGILAAQLNDGIGFGTAFLDGEKCGVDFLHKGQLRRLRQPQTGRTGDADTHGIGGVLLRQLAQLSADGLPHLGEVPLIAGGQHMMFLIQHHRFYRCRSDINADGIRDCSYFTHRWVLLSVS